MRWAALYKVHTKMNFHKCSCLWCPYNEQRDKLYTPFKIRVIFNALYVVPDLLIEIPQQRLFEYLKEIQRIFTFVLERYHNLDMRDIYVQIDKNSTVIMLLLCRVALQKISLVTFKKPSLEQNFKSILFSKNDGVRVSHNGN